MKKTVFIVYIVIFYNVFSTELSYKYFNIYNSSKYKLNQTNYEFSSDYLDLDYLEQNYSIDNTEFNPIKFQVLGKAPYYEFLYSEDELNLKEIEFEDEKINFSKEKLKYMEHKIKLPIGSYEISFNYGFNKDFQLVLLNDYIDLNTKNFSVEKKALGIKKNKTKFYYSENSMTSDILVNDISKVGYLKGEIRELGLKSSNLELVYRKIDGELDVDVDDNTAYFTTTIANRYIYADAKVDMENFEYKQKYEKKFKKSKLKLFNTLGLMKDNNSILSLKQEYYVDVLSLFLLKIKSKEAESYKEIALGDRYIYYDFLNIVYEKEFGNFIIEIEKTVPFIFNKSIIPKVETEYTENSNTGETKTNNRQEEKIKDLLLSGIKIGIKYEF